MDQWPEGTFTMVPKSNPTAHDGDYTIAFIQDEHVNNPDLWPRVVPADYVPKENEVLQADNIVNVCFTKVPGKIYGAEAFGIELGKQFDATEAWLASPEYKKQHDAQLAKEAADAKSWGTMPKMFGPDKGTEEEWAAWRAANAVDEAPVGEPVPENPAPGNMYDYLDFGTDKSGMTKGAEKREQQKEYWENFDWRKAPEWDEYVAPMAWPELFFLRPDELMVEMETPTVLRNPTPKSWDVGATAVDLAKVAELDRIAAEEAAAKAAAGRRAEARRRAARPGCPIGGRRS